METYNRLYSSKFENDKFFRIVFGGRFSAILKIGVDVENQFLLVVEKNVFCR